VGWRFAQEGLIREDYTLVDAVDKSDAITNVNATQQYLIVPLAYASPPTTETAAPAWDRQPTCAGFAGGHM
jgi:hypothetical protein